MPAESDLEAVITVPPTEAQKQAMSGLEGVYNGIEDTHLKLLAFGDDIAEKVKGKPVLENAFGFFHRLAQAGTVLRAGYYTEGGQKVDVPKEKRLETGAGFYLDAFRQGILGQVEALGVVMAPGGPIAGAGAMAEAQAVSTVAKAVVGEATPGNVLEMATKATGSESIQQAVGVANRVVEAANKVPGVGDWVKSVLNGQSKS